MNSSTIPGTRTATAFISVISDDKDRTVVMVNPDRLILPLTEVTVTLRDTELFMATGADGTVGYFRDLEVAWWHTTDHGSEGVPDAIQILTPGERTNSWKTISVHTRAVTVVKP